MINLGVEIPQVKKKNKKVELGEREREIEARLQGQVYKWIKATEKMVMKKKHKQVSAECPYLGLVLCWGSRF